MESSKGLVYGGLVNNKIRNYLENCENNKFETLLKGCRGERFGQFERWEKLGSHKGIPTRRQSFQLDGRLQILDKNHQRWAGQRSG